MPFFSPPYIDDVPPVLDGPYPWPTGPIEYRFFGHMKPRARGRTVIMRKDGVCLQPFDWPPQLVSQDNDVFSVFVEEGLAGIPYTEIARVYMGGHIYPITATEAVQLIACGYGAGITNSTWGEVVGTWQDQSTLTWDMI